MFQRDSKSHLRAFLLSPLSSSSADGFAHVLAIRHGDGAWCLGLPRHQLTVDASEHRRLEIENIIGSSIRREETGR